jgi:hypothetical protein
VDINRELQLEGGETMKYGKPEVLQLKAFEAIQSQQGVKGPVRLESNIFLRPQTSTGAYEADE